MCASRASPLSWLRYQRGSRNEWRRPLWRCLWHKKNKMPIENKLDTGGNRECDHRLRYLNHLTDENFGEWGWFRRERVGWNVSCSCSGEKKVPNIELGSPFQNPWWWVDEFSQDPVLAMMVYYIDGQLHFKDLSLCAVSAAVNGGCISIAVQVKCVSV